MVSRSGTASTRATSFSAWSAGRYSRRKVTQFRAISFIRGISPGLTWVLCIFFIRSTYRSTYLSIPAGSAAISLEKEREFSSSNTEP